MSASTPREARRPLERRLRRLEMEKLVEELLKDMVSEKPAADSTPLIREDRETG